MRKCSPREEGHERLGKGLQPVKERLQGPLATDGIAKQQREKVHDLVVSESLPHQVHLVAEHIEMPMATQIAGNEDDFGKPGRKRRLGSGSRVDVHTRMWYGAHDDLQTGNAETCFLSLEVDFSAVLQGFFSCLTLLVPRCASRGKPPFQGSCQAYCIAALTTTVERQLEMPAHCLA